jgi:uncharacterized protein (TIGR03067 family)
MKLLAGMVLTAGLLIAAEAPNADQPKKELDKLQGTWTVISAERAGEKVPEERTKSWKLVIKGDKYSFEPGDQSIEGTYKVDPSKTPKAIDATRSNGQDKGKTLYGIYALSGDELKMCFSEPGKEERPKEFSTTAASGAGHALYTFKRANP